MDYLSMPKRNGDQHFVGTSQNEIQRACPSMKLQDKLKSEKPSLSYADFHHEITKNAKHVHHKFAGDPRKHRIAGKEVDEDELVKYMSKLPSFLHKGEPVKEKALNVGVLDWGLLEKWQYKHKQIPSRSSGYSPSSSNTSSSFSTDGSSTHSSRGHSCSPTCQRTRRPSFQSHITAPLAEDSHRAVEASGTSAKTFQDFETTQTNAFDRPKTSTSTALGLNKMHPGVLPEECKKQSSEHKRESRQGSRDLQTDINVGMISYAAVKMETQAVPCTTREENIQKPDLEHSQHSDPEGNRIVLLLPKDLSESNNPVEPQDSNLATMPDRKTKVCQKSLTEGCKKAFHDGRSSDIPHPSGVRREESRVKQYSSRDSAAVSIDCACRSSKSVSQLPPNLSRERILEEKPSTVLPTCSTSLKQSKTPEQKPKKVVAEKVRSISPFDRFISGTSKSRISSSKDGLEKCNPRSVNVAAKSRTAQSSISDGSSTDKQNATGKGRSSPLRRLLQPLLKPKAENSHHFSEPLERVSVSTDKGCKSGDMEHVSMATRTVKVKLGITGCKKISVNELAMGKKNGSSTTQALLRVAVKNGLPLYTFAINNESSILAATVKKLNTEKMGGFSCIYTFFTIQDMKKKNNGSWINQGGKAKGHDYISNVVAQMKVSDSGVSHSSNKFGVREFVLFSVDLRQAEDQTSEFQPNNELAAIVVKIPKKTNASTAPTENASQACQSGFVSDFRSEDLTNTTVILPSAVHSLPSKGGPSSLIERWMTGGSCDCGGWDLGCKLRIFANPNQSHKKSSLELFPQGGVQENQQVFSLAPFKEGTYSVEFHSTLSILQAFSICTAVLDSRKKCELVESSNSVEEKNLGEPMLVQNAGTSVPTRTEAEGPRYLSYPPHSPVGRV